MQVSAGSDGADIREQALAYSDNLRSPERTRRFLAALNTGERIEWFCGKGVMGEQLLQQQGWPIVAAFGAGHSDTCAGDTAEVVRQLQQQSLDLLVFVGGDGTARDVLDQLDGSTPCLGVPAGVKMQSGVFALSPEAAAEIINGLQLTTLISVDEQDVRDIDEEALRHGRVRSRYYGSMQVPAEPRYLQRLKQSGVEDESLVLDEIADQLTEIMEDEGRVMLVGPGGTTAHWLRSLGLDYTLVGFDLVQAGQLLQADLTADDVLQWQQRQPDLLLVISPTGNQGVLIGRGNQQLSPAFLRALPKTQWRVVSSRSKLQQLHGQPLIVDSNDSALDRHLCGLYPVITAYHDQVLYPVNTTYTK